jgi:vacuolar-type H+-ATPase subunit H
LQQAKRKASEEASEISNNICTKLEQLPLRTKSAKQKKASKEATKISPRICPELADFLQRI